MSMWLRSLLLCDDARFEMGGTVSLVGVHGNRMVVTAGSGEIVLARLVVHVVVAGLSGMSEVTWRQTLLMEGSEPRTPTSEGREPHDPAADEHQFINLLSPLALPDAGDYRLAVEVATRRERRSFDHHFTVQRAAATTATQLARSAAMPSV